MKGYKYLFRPALSARFGQSLGINLTPHKTCTMDCIFCELGRTSKKTLRRRSYVPTEEVLLEVEAWLKTDGRGDFITIAGSGEPTLHSQLGEVLKFVRTNCTIPVVLLTNATLLWIPEVRGAASYANVVKICLSAWDDSSFRWMHRPHPDLEFKRVVEGQKAFRRRFKGEIWMEVFLIPGMNAVPAHSRKVAGLAREIDPDRIQLNGAVRPVAKDGAQFLTEKDLSSLCRYFEPGAEVIRDCPNHVLNPSEATASRVMTSG